MIGEALALEDTETKRLQVVLSHTEDDAGSFQVFSAGTSAEPTKSSWRLHASGSLRRITASDRPIQVDQCLIKRPFALPQDCPVMECGGVV